MANNKPLEQQLDITDLMKASPSDDHIHPVNRHVHPGLAKRSDFDTQGVEVPARAERERVNPSEANGQRRTPLIDVTAITPSGPGNHIAEPPPRKL